MLELPNTLNIQCNHSELQILAFNQQQYSSHLIYEVFCASQQHHCCDDQGYDGN